MTSRPSRLPVVAWLLLALTSALALGGGLVAASCSPPGDTTAGDRPPVEQAVLVHLPVAAWDEELALADIEDPLIAAIDAAAAGEFDGNELGPDEAVLFMYGPDADRLAEVVIPVLRQQPLPPGSYLIKRFGDVGAREERVDLTG